jgi:hypothetical protein
VPVWRTKAQNLLYGDVQHASTEGTTSATLRQPEQDQATGTVRALRAEDIPALVSLRRVAFRHSERPSRESAAAGFHDVFLANPWTDLNLPSLVFENEAGRVTGFLGVVPRPMLLHGRRIRVAVATQLMVSSAEPSLAARRLARAFIDGPQDLCLSDTANEAARRLWASVGGRTSPFLCMNWVRQLRPLGHALQRFGGLLAWTSRRFASAIERFDRPFAHRPTGVRIEPLTPEATCADRDAVLSRFELRPDMAVASQRWLFAQVAGKRQFGPMFSARLRDRRGAPLGWFLYFLGLDRTAHVLQIAARAGAESLALQCLYSDAWERGAVAVTGRAEPWLMEALLSTDGVYVFQGPWTLVHSRRREVADQLARDTSYLTRMDGEWWLSF